MHVLEAVSCRVTPGTTRVRFSCRIPMQGFSLGTLDLLQPLPVIPFSRIGEGGNRRGAAAAATPGCSEFLLLFTSHTIFQALHRNPSQDQDSSA